MQLYSMYTQSLACDEEDYNTAVKSDAGLCYTTYSECVQRNSGIFGSVCEKYRTYKCCFNSRLAKLINEQGKASIGITGRSDDCSGFSPDEFARIKWDQIDFTPFVEEILKEANKGLPKATDIDALRQKMSGRASTSGVKKLSNYAP